MGALRPGPPSTDDNTLQLEGSFGVHTLSVGESTFVFVAGFQDDGISAFELGADGSLTNLQNIDGGPPTGPLEIDQAANFASATVGGTSYLYVNGADDTASAPSGSNPSGTLTNVQNIDVPTSWAQRYRREDVGGDGGRQLVPDRLGQGRQRHQRLPGQRQRHADQHRQRDDDDASVNAR